jgi:hypothetical protein
MTLPAATLNELQAAARRIADADSAAAGPHWGAMHKLLLKAKVAPGEIMPLVAGRNLDGLHRLLAKLAGSPIAQEPAAPSPPKPAIDADTLAHAMKAFRTRLKLTRLDAESRLGVGPMSGGKKSGIDAIIPPRDYPHTVWEALAEQGKLRRFDGGFYGLAEEG